MDIAGQFQQISFFFYDDSLVASLKEVPAPTVNPVKIPRVNTVEVPQGEG
jgi:hypothetical protein